MSKKIVITYKKEINYPSKSEKFRPSIKYPEYLWNDIAQNENDIYDAVRQSFYLMGLDRENFGSSKWNPLGEILIKPGDNVLIKPNMVFDKNMCVEGNEESLYTNPSLVAAVIDYVIIALKGKGEIVIGDAPVQECDFENLINVSGYNELVEYYSSKGINIKLLDFRGLTSVVKNGIHIVNINEEVKCKNIDLAENSDFYGEKIDTIKNLRITNYDPDIMFSYHNGKSHKYCISEYALTADVIINMPKPKCHRKAGMTGALKNFIGLNARKECLPHHTKGAQDDGGDEYSKKNFIHAIRSSVIDKKNGFLNKNNRFMGQICRIFIKGCSIILKIEKVQYDEGSWYGNKTISKTISDINRIIYYADKNGILKNNRQRKIFIIGDMIISGESEGPLLPTNKKCGVIIIGDDPIMFDKTVATIMGFDYRKIPAIVNAERQREKYNLVDHYLLPEVISNSEEFNNINIDEIEYKNTFKFRAASGWISHIELSKEI